MSTSADTLDDVRDYLSRFVAWPGAIYATLVALWILHTYLIDEFDNTGRLAALSAEPASGKSRLMELVGEFAANVIASINATTAAIFRTIDQKGGQVTLVFDEIDTVYSQSADEKSDLTGLINSGYRRGAHVLRTVGEQHEAKAFPTFAPVALAGLSRAKLPDALLSRCFIIPMKRRGPGQSVEAYRQRVERENIAGLRDSLEQLAESIRPGLADHFPELPEGVQDRQQDIWEPLIAIADRVGGHWPASAREACLVMSQQAQQSKPSLGILLLQDIQDVFERLDISEICTADLIHELSEIEESPWGDWYGRPISPRKLAEILKEYEIRTARFRSAVTKQPVRGFRLPDFQDAFTRYLGAPLGKAEHPAQAEQAPESRGSGVPHSVPLIGHPKTSGTTSGTKQARKHGDVPHVPGVPVLRKGNRQCSLHKDRPMIECYTCSDIRGQSWDREKEDTNG